MNRFLVGFCLGMPLSACEVGITNSPEKIQDDTSEIESEATPETEEGEPAEDETGVEDISEDDAEEIEEESSDPLTDFSQWGPHYPYGITVDDRTASVTNCTNMNYKVYTPYAEDPPILVLGHGFARGADTVVGWAEHFASWGVEVLVPTLCHYNVFAGVDHEMNAQNMKELSDLHGSGEVVYAGHSAGGLAALIAASQDPKAIGMLGLDTTDTEGVPSVPDFIGQGYAGSVTVPSFLIIGEPSSCNSGNNGLELFKMIDGYQAMRITSADHCDFENPTDFVCELSCESASATFQASEIRPAVITLATAALMTITELSVDGPLIWSEPGVSEGLVTTE